MIFLNISFIAILIFILISIAFLTIIERKLLSSIQRRRGPDIVGFFGLFQAFADGIKLMTKEIIIPSKINFFLFIFSPILTFFCTILNWLFLPVTNNSTFLNIPFTILIFICISSLGIHGLILAGWSSNSKYSFLGAIRSAAQMISYELTLSTIIISISLATKTTSIIEMIEVQSLNWNLFHLFPMWFFFIVSALAETNRAPFDLPEAEAELVAGYNVEFSSVIFVLFFLAEYGNMLIMSIISTCLFMGGGSCIPFLLHFASSGCLATKVISTISIFIFARASLPRYRYDQLMKLGWKSLLPISFAFFIFESILLSTNIILFS